MAFLSTDSTPRERLSRLISLLRRVRMYWRSTAVIAIVGIAISLGVALTTKRIWRSETTLLYRDTIQTGQQPNATRAARLGPKLKDMIYARPKLSSVIEEYKLYPEKTERSMVEAVAEMQNHLGFRGRDSDSYVVSFSHHDPLVAQQVTARLADLIIEDYQRENMTSAKMTLDFRKRELEEASKQVEEASRSLSSFLAEHPQFQWGLGDSPYAPTPQVQAAPTHAARPQTPTASRSSDPELSALERRLAQVGARLSPGTGSVEVAAPATSADVQRARQAVAAAEAALADKLRVVTPLHPDAATAQARVDAARQELARAEGAPQVRAVPAPAAGAPTLGAEEQAALERERTSLLQQIAARRAKLQAERQGSAQAAAPSAADAATAAAAAAASAMSDVVGLETEWHKRRLNLDRARDYLKTAQSNERAANMVSEAVQSKGETEMAILDPAYLPSRPDKGRGKVFMVGVVVSLMFAFGIAGARVLLNDTIYDEADVGAIGSLPVLAAMPALPAIEPPRVRAMVPLQEPERDVPEVVEVEDDDDDYYEDADTQVVAAPGESRLHTQTLRWGSPLEVAEMRRKVAEAREQAAARATAEAQVAQAAAEARAAAHRPSEAPLVKVPQATLARVRTPLDPDANTPHGPEVEEIGDDPAAEHGGEDAMKLLRNVPPQALASLRVLRHRLERHRGEGRMIVSVLSPGPSEGKTTLAARLAMTLAEAERARVILVDGNLGSPRVASTLGLKLPGYAGLSYQIRQRMLGHRQGMEGMVGHGAGGNAPLGVVRLAPSLWVLAEPALGESYPDVVNSPHFGAALQSLRRCFDYVIVDGPAVLGSGDANVLEDVADGIVLVARSSLTRGASLTRAIAQLGDRRILGVVLNDVSERPVARKKVAVVQDATA
ncbi:polysaccharide biosynthesis tyrosine autokinase [Chondromyces apiculatus]|uniref:Uncharacterized protein n=1 Tax=Chondromyces apiculatus DSM 436 TaxID=1192034 RepID=A0A017T7V5_9BACT|nr:tyrosine-protein kinase domain-containing protein [Chondromyces apiculatus]EYF05324.1 Hypothetical protein CAP_3465 [Chondromyces apiculatus DSM 436]